MSILIVSDGLGAWSIGLGNMGENLVDEISWNAVG